MNGPAARQTRFSLFPGLLFSCALIWFASPSLSAGAFQEGVKHTVFGDFKVDETNADSSAPRTFQVTLRDGQQKIWGRETVGNEGRYRFLGIPNGEYVLIVEVEGTLVTEIPFILYESRSGEFRRDISLEWKQLFPGTPEMSGGPVYARGEKTAPLFNEALSTSQPDKSITLLEQVVRDDPADFEAWTELGTQFFRKDNVREAEAAFQRASQLEPDYLLAQLNLGKARMARKDFEGALEPLTKAIALDPDRAESHQLLGESYLQVKKGSKAVVYFEEALRLDPVGMADVHLRLATLYNAAGYRDRAANEYEQYLSIKPDASNRKQLQQYIEENKPK